MKAAKPEGVRYLAINSPLLVRGILSFKAIHCRPGSLACQAAPLMSAIDQIMNYAKGDS